LGTKLRGRQLPLSAQPQRPPISCAHTRGPTHTHIHAHTYTTRGNGSGYHTNLFFFSSFHFVSFLFSMTCRTVSVLYAGHRPTVPSSILVFAQCITHNQHASLPFLSKFARDAYAKSHRHQRPRRLITNIKPGPFPSALPPAADPKNGGDQHLTADRPARLT
jgi:hypothetical protein